MDICLYVFLHFSDGTANLQFAAIGVEEGLQSVIQNDQVTIRIIYVETETLHLNHNFVRILYPNIA